MNSATIDSKKLGLLAALGMVGAVVASVADPVAREVFGMVALAVAVTLAVELALRHRRAWWREPPTAGTDVAGAAAAEAPRALAPAFSAGRAPHIVESVAAFQQECGNLLLDAEAARVQTESCESGIRAVETASAALAGTCDVLGRRAGLTQSHALMANCATEDAADALRRAMQHTGRLRELLRRADADADEARALGAEAARSLGEAEQAIATALARGEEAARVAAGLGGAAARGERVALNLGEACRGLTPSLQEGARTGLRISMLAASLDESAGRVGRMMEAAATGRPAPPPRPPVLSWSAVEPPAATSRVTQADGNVLWVRFDGGGRDRPDVERA